MSKIVAIYDADLIAYRAAAATETRSVNVIHSSGKSKIFKNRTTFKESMLLKGKEYDKDEYKFEDLQEAEDVANALSIIKKQIERINSDLFVDEYFIGVATGKNFRETLALPSRYKWNRDNIVRPVNLKECAKYLRNNKHAEQVYDAEVDDYCVFKGYEHLAKGHTPIMVTIDKDSWAYGGLGLYDYTKGHIETEVIPEGIGYLVDDPKKITGRGFLWWALQQIIGDLTDFYRPTEIACIKFGEKSAYKLLKDCKSEQEALEVVKSTYKKWYPDKVHYKDWTGLDHEVTYKEIMQLYFKCCRMKSTKDDPLDVYEFFDKYNVKV